MEYNAVIIKQNGPSTRSVPNMLKYIGELFENKDDYVITSLQSTYSVLTQEEDIKEYEVYTLAYQVERSQANPLLVKITSIVNYADYKLLPIYAVSKIEFDHRYQELDTAFANPLLFIACTNKAYCLDNYPQFFKNLKVKDPQLWQEIMLSS